MTRQASGDNTASTRIVQRWMAMMTEISRVEFE
ncbi:hypothetical protein M6B38_340590 [Iris pallida]|uniref:MarR family transcriptional regulator n=1 Tax=Iris pallida TaxID=29817 RepID=A0AAX6GYH6_IRIPA|nr:hypothetical protein M6B38_197025 [Iris pallida]KAJ6833367.1 hypothetical protein M6B38_340590 [Iris pallida]